MQAKKWTKNGQKSRQKSRQKNGPKVGHYRFKKEVKKRFKKWHKKRDKKRAKSRQKNEPKKWAKKGVKIETIRYFMSPGHGFNFLLRHPLIIRETRVSNKIMRPIFSLEICDILCTTYICKWIITATMATLKLKFVKGYFWILPSWQHVSQSWIIWRKFRS